MGHLSRIGLDWLVRAHALDTFVETGTGHGHNLITALQWSEFTDLRSIEIDRETHHRNVVTFANEPRVKCYCGDSGEVLGAIAKVLSPARRVLWFLDAHFAGSGRIEPTPMTVEGDVGAAVPILREWAGLVANRDTARDVIVVDDLALFEEGAFEHDSPELRAQLKFPGLEWMVSALGATHDARRRTNDAGYLILTPRPPR